MKALSLVLALAFLLVALVPAAQAATLRAQSGPPTFQFSQTAECFGQPATCSFTLTRRVNPGEIIAVFFFQNPSLNPVVDDGGNTYASVPNEYIGSSQSAVIWTLATHFANTVTATTQGSPFTSSPVALAVYDGGTSVVADARSITVLPSNSPPLWANVSGTLTSPAVPSTQSRWVGWVLFSSAGLNGCGAGVTFTVGTKVFLFSAESSGGLYSSCIAGANISTGTYPSIVSLHTTSDLTYSGWAGGVFIVNPTPVALIVTCLSEGGGLWQFFANTTAGSGPFNYTWNFGDGGAAYTSSPTHRFADPNGSYGVTVTVRDFFGFTQIGVCTTNDPLTPAVNAFWILMFLVACGIIVGGAYTVRAWLGKRHGGF